MLHPYRHQECSGEKGLWLSELRRTRMTVKDEQRCLALCKPLDAVRVENATRNTAKSAILSFNNAFQWLYIEWISKMIFGLGDVCQIL